MHGQSGDAAQYVPERAKEKRNPARMKPTEFAAHVRQREILFPVAPASVGSSAIIYEGNSLEEFERSCE